MAEPTDKRSTDDLIDRAADFIGAASWPAAGLWFVGIVGFQVYLWLRLGEWVAVPTRVAFDYIGLDLAFIYEPQSWVGAARMAQWALSLPLSVVGAIIIIMVAAVVRSFLRGDL